MLSVLPRDVARWLWMLVWLVGSGTALVENHRAQAAESPEELADRAPQLADQGDNAGAIRIAAEAIAANPRLASPYKTRGREYFRAGEIVKSVQDLDRYAELEPRFEPQQ